MYNMPYSNADEVLMLQAVVYDNLNYNAVTDQIGINKDHFFSRQHKIIWGIFEKIYQDGHEINEMSIEKHLMAQGLIGNTPKSIFPNMDAVVDFFFAPSFISEDRAKSTAIVLNDMKLNRSFMTDTLKLLEDMSGKGMSATNVIEKNDKIMKVLSEFAVGGSHITPKSEVRDKLFQDFESRVEGLNKNFAMTGLKVIDELTGGMERGRLWVVGGRQHMGKTVFGISVACNLLKAGKSVLFISVEEDEMQLSKRMISNLYNIPSDMLNKVYTDNDLNETTEKEIDSIGQAIEDFNALPMMFRKESREGVTLRNIEQTIVQAVKEDPSVTVIVDYLQKVVSKGHSSREREVASVSARLKELAKFHNIAILALVQLNTNNTKRDNKMPIDTDIRESDAVSHDADVLLFIHREGYYNDDPSATATIFNLAKNRQKGTMKYVDANFSNVYQRFCDV